MLPVVPSTKLSQKRALVVGGASGIGFASAAALVQMDAKVTIAGKTEAKLENAQKTFWDNGYDVSKLLLDVTKLESITSTLGEVEPFQILVNSAGLARHAPVSQVSEEDFDIVSATNFKGAFFVTREVALRLVDSGLTGSLINISSQMGHVGGLQRSVYCATKHAVEGFTKAMAIELGKHNIRINTICPTFVRTELTAKSFEDPEISKWIFDHIKLDRVAELEDIMGAVIYLASDLSSMVTGSAMMVDGGWTAE